MLDSINQGSLRHRGIHWYLLLIVTVENDLQHDTGTGRILPI